jgi:hypothetical protein
MRGPSGRFKLLKSESQPNVVAKNEDDKTEESKINQLSFRATTRPDLIPFPVFGKQSKVLPNTLTVIFPSTSIIHYIDSTYRMLGCNLHLLSLTYEDFPQGT